MTIRPMVASDGPEVLAIYEQGLKSGHASFAEAAPSWQDWDSGHRPDCRLVAEEEGEILGWAALSPVSGRCVYGGVAEVSVYVAQPGRGVGRTLLEALVSASEQAGYWTLQAGIFPENEASVRLHQAAGFKLLGRREALGKMAYGPMAGLWRDILLLERRSRVVGRD